MKSIKLISILLLVVFVLAACSSDDKKDEQATQAPVAAEDQVVVGLVMKSLANEFFKVMQEATVAWADTRSDIELIPVGMNSETDIDTQFAAVENFVTQGVDLIVVAAADSVGMVAPVKKAVDAGITVVNFDVKLDTEALKAAGLPEDFLFVGPDNAEGAKLAGDALAEALGAGGKVIIIEGNPGADNATQRKNGFLQSIEEGGLELLDSKTAHWETEEANTVVSNLLVKYPDVEGIMCANDSMALGAVKAVEAAGLTGEILIVGFDNIPAVQELIIAGKILASVDQFGPEMAKNAIEVGLRILAGEELGGWIKTPVRLVAAADLGATPPTTGTGEKAVVGLVMKSLANEFFKVMQEATVAWADTRPDIELIPVGMNSETDIDTQFAAVENFVTQGVDLIVVAAADSVGMVAPVKKAVDAGITVVNFDVKLDVEALKAAGLPEDFLFVGPDNAEGAKLAGDALAEALGAGGKVIIIEGNPGADNATQRKNGFLQSVEEGGLELLDSKTAHWETEEANTVVSNLLVKYPDVEGIMCANDSMALGAVKAVEAAGLTGEVLIVGFDNIPAVQELIKEGKILASVDQFGPEMAKNAIEIGLRILAGEELGGWIKTPVRLIAAADLGATPPTTGTGEKAVVGLVMKSLANEFFKVMQEATVAWADTRPDIELIPVGMNSETDIDTQFAAVENFVTQDVDLIVVAAADSVGMVAPVKKAVDAGITVVNFDVKLDVEALKAAGLPEDFLFVGPDNAEGAKLAGDALAEALGAGGKVIIIEGNPGADNATQRKNGFLQSVEEGGLELLDSKTAHWETEEANTVVSNLLVRYPDVEGIMCANDSMALGAVKAVEAAGLTDEVLIVGFDNIPAVQELIKEGKILASVDQFGPEMAKNAIEVGLRILGGEELGGWIKTPVRLVTAVDLGAAPPPPPPSGDQVTITWLRLAEWGEADPAIIETFEASHPGIKVKVEEIPFSELVSQINLRFGADDTLIDVVSVDVPLVSSYGYRGWLLPLDDIYSDAELADFLEAALNAGTYNGELLAGPLSTSTQLLYYNAEVFEAAGIAPPGQDERWTWEQLAEIAQQVQVVDGDQVEVWGFQWEQTTAAYQLLPLMGSLGGEYIGEGGLTVDGVVNSQPWIDAATFYYDMFNTYGVAPQGDAVNGPDLFVNGNLAMLIAGPWQIAGFAENADFEWGVSRHPYFEGHDIATSTGSWHMGVNSLSEHPDAAKEFVRWLTTGEGAEMWWRIGSHDFPAQKSVLAMFATSAEFDEEPMYFNRVAADEATVGPIPRPVTVGYLEYDQIFRDTFQDIRIGTDPEDALNTMVERLESELAKYK